MNNLSALKFEPLYQERVWGGRGLATSLGRILPEDLVIGESWEIVDRPEAQSIVTDGIWKGRSLGEIMKTNSKVLMGPGWNSGKPFPILVKWLDCQKILSLQVHPPQSQAEKLGGEPKTEHWYVAETSGDAALIVGLKKGVSKADFDLALQNGSVEECVHRFQTMPGDSLLVESGRLHAIDAGNLILEIQQNSDTTYRVYDWGRIGLDGKPRTLHVAESLQCIDFDDFEPAPIRLPEIPGNEDPLVDCPEFNIVRKVLKKGSSLIFPTNQSLHLLSIVSGSLVEQATNIEFSKGDNLLLPYAADCQFYVKEDASFLVTKPHL